MPINIKVEDAREDKTVPPIDIEKFDVESVFKFADIVTAEDETLDVVVRLHNGVETEQGRTPTSVLQPGMKEELYELELIDAKSEEVVKVWQKREVPDTSSWTINVLLLPKEELAYGSLRAISRGISREVFHLSVFRAYGPDMVQMIYPTPKEFMEAQTKFADDAPWALS